MVKKFHQDDPHFEREQKKYDNPIPSREWIKSFLTEKQKPLSKKQIIKRFSLFELDQQEALRRRLNAMVRDGQLVLNQRGQYSVTDHIELLKGIVIGRRDGYGMVRFGEQAEPLYIAPRQMRSLFPGDEVLLRPGRSDYRGRALGHVVEVLSRNKAPIVGRYQTLAQGKGGLVPVDPSINHEILIDHQSPPRPNEGDYVLATIQSYPSARHSCQAEIVEVLGHDDTPGIESKVMLHVHQVPQAWSETLKTSLRHIDHKIESVSQDDREDLTDLPLVTIDGEDAKDFDDAVFCEQRGRGWRLVVAIADVSHYVVSGSELDQEASRRGNSVYLPQCVVPMLPEVLANDLCSLKPNVPRLAMVCDMQINHKGQLDDYRFYPAVIRSSARLTYEQVSAMLDQQLPMPKALTQTLLDLHQLYQTLLAAREVRGALDFDSTQLRLVLNESKQVDHIVRVERTVSHRIIEECMLIANVASADFLTKHHFPVLYRVHEGPNVKKLADLRSFLQAFGLSLGGRLSPKTKDFSKLLQQVRAKPEATLLQTVILRSLQQAVYSPENLGHFGLAYSEYVHFTSPIRRYPDLQVHRAIKQILQGHKPDQEAFAACLVEGEHCSMTERRADLVGRDVADWLKCRYMETQIGEVFDGAVSTVTSLACLLR